MTEAPAGVYRRIDHLGHRASTGGANRCLTDARGAHCTSEFCSSALCAAREPATPASDSRLVDSVFRTDSKLSRLALDWHALNQCGGQMHSTAIAARQCRPHRADLVDASLVDASQVDARQVDASQIDAASRCRSYDATQCDAPQLIPTDSFPVDTHRYRPAAICELDATQIEALASPTARDWRAPVETGCTPRTQGARERTPVTIPRW
jgi:hypothetical protein